MQVPVKNKRAVPQPRLAAQPPRAAAAGGISVQRRKREQKRNKPERVLTPARRDLQRGQPAAGQPQPATAAAFPLLLAPSRAAKLPARQRLLRGSHGDPLVAAGMLLRPSLPPLGEEGREKAPFFLPGRPSLSAGVRPSWRRFAGGMR